jgi:zinc protease
MRRPRRAAVPGVLVLAAIATALPIGASGVQGGGAQNQAVVMKGRAPVSSDVLRVKLPAPAEADLPNGLHLMVLEDRRLPQVSFQLMIPGAGGYYDPADLPGLASFTTAMMREGAGTRSTLQIAELLETKAASVVVSTGLSSPLSTISGSALTEHLELTFDLAADVLLRPTFPQEEIDRYRTRTKAALVQQRANPGFLANEIVSRVMFGAHPAGRAAPTAEALDRTSREAMVEFHRTRFVPDHAVLAFAGDISLASARALVQSKLGAWARAGTAPPAVVDPPAVEPARVHFVGRPNSVQTTLWAAAPALSRTSADFDVVSVMNAVLGGGPTGRLFTILREVKGYTYGAYSNVNAPQYKGHWVASLDVRTDVTEPALKDLLAEIARMRTEPVPAREFEDRKRGMVASFALSLESPQAVLSSHMTRWLYRLPANYWDTYADRIMAVTPAQVLEKARQYLDPARMHLVAVGDPSKVAALMAQFGPVTTYDANGVRIK